ncbi:hypothetical protein C1646_662484 [Rhizophagus diaphanus]|nr:hypothetical protein C1646_662484 [Rhizophagus diaphanus] [Rhizophagus sp. MUCL 43196]
MKDLPAFLNNPTTAFFIPEKEAGPDLVCIVEFHTSNGIVEVPLFLQTKLVKDPSSDTGGTTDPHHFYSHGDKRTELKEKLRSEVLDCLESKYCKAHELLWIRFLVVFPAETKAKSKYITHDEESRPHRTVASYYNYSKANELFIVIDPSNAELFFSSFGHNVLKELKRIADNDEQELEQKIKTSD